MSNLGQNLIILFDDVPPLLNITSPSDGLITNSSILQVIGTTDSDARVTLNGQLLININGNVSQSWWLDEGLNTLIFQAKDPAGNVAEIIRNVTLKTIGPSVRILEPADGSVTNQNPIWIRGITNGTHVEVDGAPVGLRPNGTFECEHIFSQEGRETIVATAWDIANNTASARTRVEYDLTPPTINITVPINGSYTNLRSCEVRGRILGASDASLDGHALDIQLDGTFAKTVQLVDGRNEIAITAEDTVSNRISTSFIVYLDMAISLDIDSPQDGMLINTSIVTIRGHTDFDAVITVGAATLDNHYGNFTSTAQLDEGLNRITVSSVDRAGNKIEKTVRITVDTIPPEIVVLAPLEPSVKMKDLELRIRSEAGALVTVNGIQVNGSGDIFTTSVSLLKGDNRFVITAKDPAGNLNTTEKVVTYTPPKPPGPNGKTDNGPMLAMAAIIIMCIIGLAASMLIRKKRAA